MIYGHNKTIHGTQHLDVEVDKKGRVVAVWFRCLELPFVQHEVGGARAKDMISTKERVCKVKLNAVDVDTTEADK